MRIAVALAALSTPVWAACGVRVGEGLGTSRVVEVGTQGGLEVGLKVLSADDPARRPRG